MFNDDAIAYKILNSKSPFEAKGLSRKIKNFDMEKWKKNAQDIAVEGVYRKFSQNDVLLKMLKSMKATKIVEASKDQIWGTGVPLNSDHTLNEEYWDNQGLMCTVYQVVREMVK